MDKNEMKYAEREKWIDILRGIAITLVLCAHSVLIYPIDISQNWLLSWVLEFIKVFYMPLFFIVSGYLLRKNNYLLFLIRKAKRLLIPYFLWGGANICLHIVGGKLVSHQYELKTAMLRLFLYGGEYWFLFVLFCVCIFAPIVLYVCNKSELFIIFELFLIILARLFQTDFLCLNKVIYYLIFFTLGQFFYQKKSQKKQRMNKLMIMAEAFILIVIVVLKKEVGVDVLELDIIAAIAGSGIAYIIACRSYDNVLFRYFEAAGVYSLGFYILNGYCLVAARVLIVNIIGMTNPYIVYLLIVASNCLGALIICKIASRIRPTALMLGIPYMKYKG